jgi:FAD/FMN-containing dehydrogenase/Fe-S oxidoreductase
MQLPVINHVPITTGPLDADLVRSLAAAVEGEVRVGEHDRLLYSTDASLYQVEPLAIVIPTSTDDVVRAVRWCGEHGVAILPRGGGTSLAGQCTNRAVVIDVSARCWKVLEVDGKGQTARAEAGITLDDLNDAIASTGHFFAPDPATSKHANLGGAIGNNAAGGRSVRYGRTSENVVAVDCVLADGMQVRFEKGAALRDRRVGEITERVAGVVQRHRDAIKERFPKTIRRNAGYALDMILAQLEEPWKVSPLENVNLAHLLCGSEGTLAVTLDARVRLHPKPLARGIGVISFVTLEDAINAVKPILDMGKPLGLTAIEMLDDVVLDAARGNLEYRHYVDMLPGANAEKREPKAVLYVEFFAWKDDKEIDTAFDGLAVVLSSLSGVMPDGYARHTDPASMLKAWKLRKAGEPLLHGLPGDRKPVTFVEDNAVPVENLSEFVREFKKIVARHGTIAAYWAHASVGVLHIRPLINLHDVQDRAIMQAIAVEAADLARRLGGVMSGEHGDGRVRGPLLERYFGRELMEAFREIKAIFDPQGLLNPGNIVAPGSIESITQSLRIEPKGEPLAEISTHTRFEYEREHGFGQAVEMCNGAGVCRKKTGGTMCPSYMATMDERHSTRGRGNALRLAITGQIGSANGSGPVWNDPETLETLNLCLSCKACKSECPSNVDISKLKAEYLAKSFDASGGPTLKASVFGAVRLLGQLGSMTWPLANTFNRTGPAKWILERVLGLDQRRSVPRFCRSLESEWKNAAAAGRPKVALFGDCFTMYNEASIGMAAKRVLEACGYEVVLANAGCCGRAKISMGLLDQAIDEIDATMERLLPLIDDVQAIVVAEPSCLSAIKDDWLSLRVRTPLSERQRVANKAWLVEDFVEKHWEKHPQRPQFVTGHTPLLHAHCHQKALWGAESSAALLRRACGGVKVLETGCCGMAGSFGYTSDRYDLSMQIGELTLFPALRKESAAPVCAPGTSCRHQIHDGAGMDAVHPIQLVAQRLKS